MVEANQLSFATQNIQFQRPSDPVMKEDPRKSGLFHLKLSSHTKNMIKRVKKEAKLRKKAEEYIQQCAKSSNQFSDIEGESSCANEMFAAFQPQEFTSDKIYVPSPFQKIKKKVPRYGKLIDILEEDTEEEDKHYDALRTLFKARLLDQFPQEAGEARADLVEQAQLRERRERNKNKVQLVIRTRAQQLKEKQSISQNLKYLDNISYPKKLFKKPRVRRTKEDIDLKMDEELIRHGFNPVPESVLKVDLSNVTGIQDEKSKLMFSLREIDRKFQSSNIFKFTELKHQTLSKKTNALSQKVLFDRRKSQIQEMAHSTDYKVDLIPPSDLNSSKIETEESQMVDQILKSPKPSIKYQDLISKKPLEPQYVYRTKDEEPLNQKLDRAMHFPMPYRLEQLRQKQKLLDRVLNIMDRQKKPAFLSNVVQIFQRASEDEL